MSDVAALVSAVRGGLARVAEPDKAPGMQQYMHSEMPYRGVTAPARRILLRQVFADFPLADRDDWLAAIDALWREAEYREERYCAVALADERRYRQWRTPDLVPTTYRRLITEGAWWDFVDELAARHVGPLLLAAPKELTGTIRGWAADEDRWLRRTAVICQLKAGPDTDTDLLIDAIEANQTDPDFFLRKGIGWALRQHARTDPDWVRDFVAAHPRLSPLSVREATKHL
jgi:3-methyladenine DNA glycosylase AlkD